MRARLIILSLGILLIQAVNGSLDAQTVRDSAGIRVVRYTRESAPRERWTVDPKPVLEVGGVAGQGPSEFSEIRGVVRLQDGRIAVANGATNEIRMFRQTGEFQVSAGRSGSGPGEFRRLVRLFLAGDELFGVDGDTRAQVFTADGKLARSVNPAIVAGGRNPRRVGVLRDGSNVVVATGGTQQAASGDVMYPYSVYRSAANTDTFTPLFELPGYREVRVGKASSRLSLDGEGTVTVRDRRICAGFSSRFDVACYDASGEAIMRIVRETDTRTPTDPEKDVVRNAYLSANRDAPPRVREQMEKAVQEFRFADRVPAFSRLQLGATGELWVSEFDPGTGLPGPTALLAPTRPQKWSVFSTEGAWLSDIVLPARFIAHDMGRDYVAGTSFDADGVERVTVWRVRRP